MRERVWVLIRMVFCGWSYGNMIGPTSEIVGTPWRSVAPNQAFMLQQFKVRSLNQRAIFGWCVWGFDLIDPKPWIPAVFQWILKGEAT